MPGPGPKEGPPESRQAESSGAGGGEIGDYGHELLFGSFITPSAEDPQRVLESARLTEELGLDLVTLQDHPYQSRFLESWTTLSAIASQTSRVRLALNVANLPLRPPVQLARSIASLDLLSSGRVELGLGAGAFWDAIWAMGGPRRSPGEAVAALEEAIPLIRATWAGGGPALRLEGEHYQIRGARPGPAPAHRVEIWIGAIKPRMLALTGRLGDGWLPSSPYVPPEQLEEKNRRIDRAAEAAGRRPEEIRRLYNLAGSFDGPGPGFLQGPPAVWAEQLARLTLEQGMSGYIVMGDDVELLRRFAEEVVPEVRELVAAGRGERAALPSSSPRPAVRQAPDPLPESAPGRTGAELRAEATPDEGRRLSPEQLWDETERPSGPAPDPERRYSPLEEAMGHQLIAIHDHLRSELTSVEALVEQVLAGALDSSRAREELAQMTLRQNNWTMCAYCAAYCRLVSTHHAIEDRSVFPHLDRSDPRLHQVIERLKEEHRVIHRVIENIDQALLAYVAGPDGSLRLRQALDQLSDTLLSHLSYEEKELVEPLARYGFY